jgi:hypothetical protein
MKYELMNRSGREIGGEFELFKKAQSTQGCDWQTILSQDEYQLLASGRDGLSMAIDYLGLMPGDQVLFPAYLCDSVIRPFIDFGITPVFYHLNGILEIDESDIKSKISLATKALLIIHYFGMPQSAVDRIQRDYPTLRLIHDCSHSALSLWKNKWLSGSGVVIVASLRKLLPVPDGGVFLAMGRPKRPLREPRFSLAYNLHLFYRWSGGMMKHFWLRWPLFPKEWFICLFVQAEYLLSIYPKPIRMSFLSRVLLAKIDLGRVIFARRRNFNHLLAGIKNRSIVRPLFSELPPDICPLGFPVIVEDRESLKKLLVAERIYPPIHWDLPDDIDRTVFATESHVSKHILTIPIDQRYDENDMDRVIGILKQYRGVR